MPTEPTELPTRAVDRTQNIDLNNLPSIAKLLSLRANATPKRVPFVTVDKRGKDETTATYETIHGRAAKIAMLLKTKGNLQRGQSVLLIYRRSEFADFVAAIFGCFYAGIVAVPVVFSPFSDQLELVTEMTERTSAHIALTTDVNFKSLTKDWTAQARTVPTIEWWKTEGTQCALIRNILTAQISIFIRPRNMAISKWIMFR